MVLINRDVDNDVAYDCSQWGREDDVEKFCHHIMTRIMIIFY